jgi:hypothetical protein
VRRRVAFVELGQVRCDGITIGPAEREALAERTDGGVDLLARTDAHGVIHVVDLHHREHGTACDGASVDAEKRHRHQAAQALHCETSGHLSLPA